MLNRYTGFASAIGSCDTASISEVMVMGRNKKASNPSQKKLVKYFRYAAKDVGQASEEAVNQNKCYPDVAQTASPLQVKLSQALPFVIISLPK